MICPRCGSSIDPMAETTKWLQAVLDFCTIDTDDFYRKYHTYHLNDIFKYLEVSVAGGQFRGLKVSVTHEQ